MQSIEKLLEKQQKTITVEVKRHIDVLKEDFDSKVQVIAEQYDSIIEKLDSYDKKLDSQSEKLENHDMRLASHDMRLASIGKDIEIIKVDISFIKNGLKQKVDVEEFHSLEKRVAILEAKLVDKQP